MVKVRNAPAAELLEDVVRAPRPASLEALSWWLDNHTVELRHKTNNLFCGLLDKARRNFPTVPREFFIKP
jgi:hypothetical protein